MTRPLACSPARPLARMPARALARPLLLGLLLLASQPACSLVVDNAIDDDDGPRQLPGLPCPSGGQLTCTCPDGSAGLQQCFGGSTLGPCMCPIGGAVPTPPAAPVMRPPSPPALDPPPPPDDRPPPDPITGPIGDEDAGAQDDAGQDLP